MLIKPAYAQAAGGEPSFLISLLPLLLIFVVFWFLLIRPQQKRMKDHKQMIAALKKGDKVLTSGGIYGSVYKVVDDATLEVEIATGVRVRMARATITENLSGTTATVPRPANNDQPKKGAARKDKEPKPAQPVAEPEPMSGDSADATPDQAPERAPEQTKGTSS